ncbi:MAG: glycosyltransferase family 2 protein [Desulfobacterales bacterium]|uniref:Glycosyltransferase family 2 protein n=1 Tax=Candidatus Desulfatibia vada TaxID=2841696 RepID=A0A8J6P0B0_9BACT|nr:glycosyltransferase family 2 protein [Candidatus Desulfatibia vada]
MPKTLIAIPVYNAEEFIARTLLSCLNQTLKSEILVVDNCSTDTSREIVEKFQEQYNNINLVVNDRNLGRVGNWNRCLDLFDESPYEYIKFVFTGDELLPECVEKVENVFNSNSNLSVVAWPYLYKDTKGRTSVARILNYSCRLSREDLIKTWFFPSNFAGAIICHTYSKKAIQQSRFNDLVLGAATFCDEVIIRGDSYHLNEVLSIYNLDGHSSHNKMFSYLYVLERSFTKAVCLEKNKEWIGRATYQKIRTDILLEAFLNSLKHSDVSTFLRLPFKIFTILAVFIKRAVGDLAWIIKKNWVVIKESIDN